MDKHEPPYWKQHLLVMLGAPRRHENIRFFAAWCQAEGGDADWNPLNTTLPLPGATDYNRAGVKNYTRAGWGVAATYLTLTGPASGPLTYGKIVGHLQAGTYTAEQIVAACADQIRTWGTSPDLMSSILKEMP